MKQETKERKINICGIEYTVKYIEPNSREDVFMGRSDPQQALITINSSMSEEVQKQSLVHEWLHMVLNNYCLEETNNEQLVQTLASELYRCGFEVDTIHDYVQQIEYQRQALKDLTNETGN